MRSFWSQKDGPGWSDEVGRKGEERKGLRTRNACDEVDGDDHEDAFHWAREDTEV